MRAERGVVVPLSSSLKAGKRWRLSGRGGRKRLRVAEATVSENDAWLGGRGGVGGSASRGKG